MRLFREGKTPDEIAALRQIGCGTIINHLASAISAGEKLDITSLVSAAEQQEIRAAFRRFPGGLLSPIKEALPPYTYEQIRLVAATLALI